MRPYSPGGVLNALAAALKGGNPPTLSTHIRTHFLVHLLWNGNTRRRKAEQRGSAHHGGNDAAANALSTPPGEYDRKVETQRN